MAPRATWNGNQRSLKKPYRADLLKEKANTTEDTIGITFGYPAPHYVASLINRLVMYTQVKANRRTPTDGACWSNCAAALRRRWRAVAAGRGAARGRRRRKVANKCNTGYGIDQWMRQVKEELLNTVILITTNTVVNLRAI